MVEILTSWFILFGWISFILLSFAVMMYLDKKNYFMGPVYLIWGIVFLIVTCIAMYIS